MPKTYDIDWTDVDEDTAKLVLKQGELFLDAQLRVSLAADQRAMVTGAALVALASAIVTASIALSTISQEKSLLSAGLPMAGLLIIAAVVAIRAARPVPFGHAGTEPKEWGDDLVGANRAVLIGGEAENYQTRIEINERALSGNARRLNTALVLALAAPFFGAAAWTVSPWLCQFLLSST